MSNLCVNIRAKNYTSYILEWREYVILIHALFCDTFHYVCAILLMALLVVMLFLTVWLLRLEIDGRQSPPSYLNRKVESSPSTCPTSGRMSNSYNLLSTGSYISILTCSYCIPPCSGTKHSAHRLKIMFGLSGMKAAELHGNLTQAQRLEVISFVTTFNFYSLRSKLIDSTFSGFVSRI
jgi:hypothetical protein